MMARTSKPKVQVTLDAVQYRRLVQVARRDGKKLAAVVRESVEKYCVEPEVERTRQTALGSLLGLPPQPVPDDYSHWEFQYGALKRKQQKKRRR
jgi:hypothetical protein